VVTSAALLIWADERLLGLRRRDLFVRGAGAEPLARGSGFIPFDAHGSLDSFHHLNFLSGLQGDNRLLPITGAALIRPLEEASPADLALNDTRVDGHDVN